MWMRHMPLMILPLLIPPDLLSETPQRHRRASSRNLDDWAVIDIDEGSEIAARRRRSVGDPKLAAGEEMLCGVMGGFYCLFRR